MSSSFSSYRPITVSEVVKLFRNPESYRKLLPYKKNVLHNHGELTPILIQAIEIVLQDNEKIPWQILMAMRVQQFFIKFLKELMDTHDDNLVFEVQHSKILESLMIFSTFDSSNKDPDRGKFLFSKESDKDEQKLANSIFRLSLECIQVWASWYPVVNKEPSLFAIKYKELKTLKVEFPKFVFFDVEQVKEVYTLKCNTIQFSKLKPNEELLKWDEYLKSLREELIQIGRSKYEKQKFDFELNKIFVEFKQYIHRASELESQISENKLKLKSWRNFTSFYNESYIKYKERKIKREQLIHFWENYEESLEVMDFEEMIDLMGGDKQIQDLKQLQETGHSSLQQCFSEATFDFIVKEKDALIEKLERERVILLNKLEFYKLEYYELQKKYNGSDHLLHLQECGVQLQQIEPEPDDL